MKKHVWYYLLTFLAMILALSLFQGRDREKVPDTEATPSAVPLPTPEPLEPPLRLIMGSAERDTESGPARLLPRQALIGSLPEYLTVYSTFFEAKRIPMEIVPYLERLNWEQQDKWPTELVEELNNEVPANTEQVMTIAKPIQLSNGRWYTLVEWARPGDERPVVTRIALFHYLQATRGSIQYPKTVVAFQLEQEEANSQQVQGQDL